MSATRPGPVRLALVHWRVNALHELQYRANLVVQLAQSAISLGTGLVVLSLVFSRTDELRGWTRPDLMVVLGTFTILGGLVRGFVQPSMDLLLEDVQRGTLDQVLAKPADALLLVSVRRMAVWQLVEVVLGLVVLVAGLVERGTAPGVGEVAAFVVLLALGTLLVYAFWVILTAGAFWVVRMGEIHELFNGVFRAGSYPVTVYPRWLRWSLTFLVPVGFAVTVPAQSLTGRLDAGTVVLAVAVTAGALALARLVWRAGLRRYGSASS